MSFKNSDGGFAHTENGKSNNIACYQALNSLVDLYKYNTPYDTIDGTHPNTNGMKTLAELIIGNIINNEAINRIETKDIYVTNKVTDNQKNVFSKIKELFRKNKN